MQPSHARERGDVDGDEQHGEHRRQTVEAVRVSGLDDRDGDAGGGNRPLRARRRVADGAGERPEAEGGPEAERSEVPVARQQHVFDQLRVEHARWGEQRRLAEQGYGLGDDHQNDTGRDETPQPRGHPAGDERRERHAESERESEQREPTPDHLEACGPRGPGREARRSSARRR